MPELHCDFAPAHKSLRMTLSMDTGLPDALHDVIWLANLIDAATPNPHIPQVIR